MLAASEQIWASYFFQSIYIQFIVNYRHLNVYIQCYYSQHVVEPW